ncbi:MAG: hypothetical protein VKK42_20990 [Lyngbya sp.]|nr:hypothetical protein [Lyngbya sp.]
MKNNIYVGYYLEPYVWIGDKSHTKNAKELVFMAKDISPGIDIGIQRQGLVIASIQTANIPEYCDNNSANALTSQSTSFILDFFNALSFSIYEAQMRKYAGGFCSIPQEISIRDLYLWLEQDKSIPEINYIQPASMFSGEFYTFQEMISRGKKSIGIFLNDINFMTDVFDVDEDVFTQHLDKRLLNHNLLKLFALLNRGVTSIRSASFDMSLISIWSVIESIIRDIFSDLLNSENYIIKDSKVFKILKGNIKSQKDRDISVYLMTKELKMNKTISKSIFDEINLLRNQRNNLIHQLKPVNSLVCSKAFLVVKELIYIKYSIQILHHGAFFVGDIKFPEEV